MYACGFDLSDLLTMFLHLESALSVTLHVLITTTSGFSSIETLAKPFSESCRATVDVSLKLSLQPNV